MVCSLAAFEGDLHAATWEGGPAPRGRVWRLRPDGWEDCGSPWDSNAVSRLAVHGGSLYAGVSRLRGGGSGLEDSANQEPGGRILRYEGGTSWADQGRLEGAAIRSPRSSRSPARCTPRRCTRRACSGSTPRGRGRGADRPAGGCSRWGSTVVRCTAPATTTPTWTARSRSRGRASWSRRARSGAAAGCSAMTAARCGRVAGSSRTRPSSTRSRRMEGGCTSGPGPRGSCTVAADLDAAGDATWEPIGRLGDETRDHEPAGVQRDAVRGDAAARAGLPLRRRRRLDADRHARPHARRPLPPGRIDGAVRRRAVRGHAPVRPRPLDPRGRRGEPRPFTRPWLAQAGRRTPPGRSSSTWTASTSGRERATGRAASRPPPAARW